MSIAFRAKTNGQGTGSTATITAPAGLTDGDIIVAVLICPGNSSQNTPPGGWTTQLWHQNAIAPDLFVWTKKASGEGASWNFQVHSGAVAFGWGAAAYKPTAGSTLDIDTVVTNAPAESSGTSVTASSATPSTSDDMLITVHACDDNLGSSPPTFTPPSGMTERLDQGDAVQCSVEISDLLLSSNSATGTKVATAGATIRGSAAVTILLKEASAAVGGRRSLLGAGK